MVEQEKVGNKGQEEVETFVKMLRKSKFTETLLLTALAAVVGIVIALALRIIFHTGGVILNLGYIISLGLVVTYVVGVLIYACTLGSPKRKYRDIKNYLSNVNLRLLVSNMFKLEAIEIDSPTVAEWSLVSNLLDTTGGSLKIVPLDERGIGSLKDINLDDYKVVVVSRCLKDEYSELSRELYDFLTGSDYCLNFFYYEEYCIIEKDLLEEYEV